MLFITLLPLLSILPFLALSAHPVCYSMDGQVLGDHYKPCNPSAEFSACCALNGTSPDNDICLSTGLCQSTSGWFSGFIWADGCTDQTGQAIACPNICAHMPAQYSFNVLQCNPGTFCCRAGYDKKNCCNDTDALVQTSHIGTLLLPSGAEVNTTYIPPSNSPNTVKATCSTAAVGGALGAILAAVLIGAAVALFFLLNKRKAMEKSLAEVQGQRDAAIEQVRQQPKMDYFPPPDQASQLSYGAQHVHQRPQEMDVGQYNELSNEAPERELSTERD